MNLWLLCCVLLFITSQGYGWLSQQAWFFAPDLGLPWILLGGTGLAIASNRHLLRSPSQERISSVSAPSKAASFRRTSSGPLSAATTPELRGVVARDEPVAAASKPTSISFEIEPKRARSESS